MIDINNTLDLVKLKFYNEWLYSSHISNFAEENSLSETVTKQVVDQFIDPLNLPKNSVIVDMGCGVGYFLNLMKERGYTNLTGVTLSDGDIEACKNKGINTKKYDFSFIPQKDGYWDESIDFIFMRQALASSPYPIFTLMEYNRLLKLHGKMYIETPCPDNDRNLEAIENHYSIMGQRQLLTLLTRTGFAVDSMNILEVEGEQKINGESKKFTEKYYSIIVTKRQPIDVK